MAQFGTGNDDFDRLTRQYWSQWGELMRGGAATAQAPSSTSSSTPGQMPGWNQAIDWWSQLARGGNGQANEANEAISRFNSQARDWFGQMQQVASQFAGRDASAPDIAQAWKQALGGSAGNPFAQMMRGMGGSGQHGVEDWMQQAMPFLQGLQKQWSGDSSNNWSDMPAFGLGREHQQRLQRLMQAQRDAQQHSQGYHALMAEAGQDAFARFERKLAERSQTGQQLTSARALFDLWIDAAEEAYADIALSPRFRDAYAAMVNAQMTLRACVQQEIGQLGELLGTPTRTEVDAAHRKIAQLQRELRQVRAALQEANPRATGPAGRSGPVPRAASGAPEQTAKKPVAKRAAKPTRKSPRKAAKKATTKKRPAKKAAAEKSPAKRSPSKPVKSKRRTATRSTPATSKRAAATGRKR